MEGGVEYEGVREENFAFSCKVRMINYSLTARAVFT
jgi:hypothetical protein